MNKDFCGEQGPEVEVFGPTTRGHRRSRERTASQEEISPEGLNPKDGTGMKQGRQMMGG
jgi:hypothetical protein